MKYLQYVIIAVVAAIVVVGLYFAGSPQRARALRLDDRRVGDLQTLQNQIVWHWQTKKVLPSKLADLADTQPGFEAPMDPDTKLSYEYRVVDGLKFELCATFALATPADSYNRGYNSYAYPQSYIVGAVDWTHAAGRVCFNRTIDKAQYDKDQLNQQPGYKPVPMY